MPALLPQLSILTAAKEVTWGTGVTATYKLADVMDSPAVKPGNKFDTIPTVGRGISKNAYVVARKTEVPPAFTWKHVGTYDDISYHLEQLMGVISPTGSNPYVRAGQAPLTSGVTAPRFQTMYLSNLDATDGFFYKYLGTIAKKITLSCKSNDYLQLSVERLAKQVASADATLAATGSLTDRSVTTILGNDMTLFMDAAGGTVGSTAISPAGFEWNMELESNRKLITQLGGSTAVAYQEGDWTGKMTLKLLWNAANKAFVDATFGTATAFQKLIRAKFTTGASAIMQFDFGGTLMESPDINESGEDTVVVTMNFAQRYDSALGNWLKYSNTNAVATLA